MSEWTDTTRALLGKRVKVTLARANEQTGEEAVIARGIFLGFGQGGDLEIQEEDGFVHYCWPLLDIEEVL